VVQNETGSEPLMRSVLAQWPRKKSENFEILASGIVLGPL